MEIKEESSIISDKIIQNEVEIESNLNNKNDESSQSIKSEEKKYKAEILTNPNDSEFKDSLMFKIILIGNSGVGKTSITNNALKNIFFESYRATIGMEIFSLFVKVNHKIIKLQIWDTCGQEIYRSLITNFYRNSSLAVIVYSIDKKTSFKDIDLWLKELRLYSSPDIKIILIGNKSDLEDKREVTYEEGAKYELIRDVAHTNSVHKIYVTSMGDAAQLQSGDLIAIYRTNDGAGPARYRSVITSICQIEEVKTNKDFADVDSFLAYANYYSIFNPIELRQWYGKKNFTVLKMTYNIALTKRVTNGYLVDELKMVPKYWGFFQLTDEQFNAILKKGEVDESIIIN